MDTPSPHNISARLHTNIGIYAEKGEKIMIMDRIALLLTVVGALNWGSIGLFQFDIVGWICGGSSSLLSRIIFTVVGIAGIWCISLFFRSREALRQNEE